MSDLANLEDARRRYFVGLAKSGGTASTDALPEFTLAAMRSRFMRASRRGSDGDGGIALSDEPLLPEAARPILILLCGAKQTDQLTAAAAIALRQAGVRPHPFDFYRLEDFIIRFAPDLGATARAWASKVQPSQATIPVEGAEPVTADTFATASRAAKLAFLHALRSAEPDRARDVIAQNFPQEPAASRSDFLDVLVSRLGENDFSFLNAATSDKAQAVRAKAEQLLQRVPGTPQYRERLARLPDYVKVKTALISRKKTLSLTGDPAAIRLGALCSGIRLDDLAQSLGISVEDLAAAASDVAGLSDVVLNAIIAERKFDLIRFYEAALEDAGWLAGNILHDALAHASQQDRDTLVQRLITPTRWNKMPEAFSLQRLYAGLGGPLSEPIAQELLNAKAYKEMLARDHSPALVAQVEALAPLIPRTQSEVFIEDVRQISPRAGWFHRFSLALPQEPPGRP